VLVATTDAADESRVQALAGQKVQIAKLPALDGGIDIEALLTELGRRSIGSLLVEGGPTLAATLLRNDLVDRLVLFVAPRLLGDPMALPLVGDLGLRDLAAARSFCVKSIRSVGPDVRIDLAPDTPVLT
jgi:diaminohydroxyphosphoribosylaminopyrimidine deaminase/5-amino-6-(5-phosphoribosylamino)uracil reductase